MKLRFSHPATCLLLALTLLAAQAPLAQAAPRHNPGNPRGIADPRGALDPRGIADPRGVLDPRGIADPRGVFDPRGPFDPRNPARYMYAVPTGYRMVTYGAARYYVCSGFYYYPYIINGQTVYVKAAVVNGVPTVPPRPY